VVIVDLNEHDAERMAEAITGNGGQVLATL
jgi:hypothetical protein